jgi:multidrug resistance efflux pump
LLPIQQMELSFGTGGFVESVEIGVGESVRAGQVLVRLDSTEAGLALQQAEAELAAAQANYDLVVAITPAEQKVSISAANLDLIAAQQALAAIHADADLAAAGALQAVVDAQKAVDDAQRYLNGITSTANQAFIDAAYANTILAQASLDKAKEAYEPWRNKPENNITRATLLSKLAQALQVNDAAVRKYNGILGSASEIDLFHAEANLALAQAQLVDAQGTYQTLKEGPDPDAIALAEAHLANAQARLTLAEAGGSTADQLTLAQAQVDAARSNLGILQAQGDQMIITAPYDGVISIVRASQGEWAIPGEMIVAVLDTSRWRIETKNVGELQIGQVQIGQAVQVSVNAFKSEALSGYVVAISPIAIVQQGDTTYTLSIELEPTDLNLWPGMTTQVEIQIDGDP